jgi:hypothetical protein
MQAQPQILVFYPWDCLAIRGNLLMHRESEQRVLCYRHSLHNHNLRCDSLNACRQQLVHGIASEGVDIAHNPPPEQHLWMRARGQTSCEWAGR